MRSLKLSATYQYRVAVTAVSLVLAMTLLLLSRPYEAEGSRIDTWGDAAAWTLLLAGVALRVWATVCIAGRKGNQVVDFGPYALCRNPLYVGTLMIALALFFSFRSPTFGILLLVPVVVYLHGVVPAEEAYLAEKLGEPYRAYCRAVPRWLPQRFDPRVLHVGDVRIGPLLMELSRSLWWLALLPAAEYLQQLRAEHWLPYLWPFP